MPESLSSKVEKHFSESGLPVAECLPRLFETIRGSRLSALKAPPGSGKTILCPLALWEEFRFSRVLILEPRRVTARLPSLALEKVVGDLVGYRIRLESRWNQQNTRIGYLTYGTALRLFAGDPPDERVLVVFDEFHERSWEAELLLAYLRSLKNGPVLLLMSATLDLDSLPADIPVVESDGRLHPVSVSHESREPQLAGDLNKLAGLMAERSAELHLAEPGEQLIFLPGLREIRAVREKLLADHLPGDIDILHSSLPESEIRRVVERPPGQGFRRILSTDLAESSVTLPGITVVIDAGLARKPLRDELDLGVTLRTEMAPLSALEQRAGRAGRVKSGLCHRMFTHQAELHRPAFPTPELDQADYRTLVLFLASLGCLRDAEQLPWLYPPNEIKLASALAWCRRHRLVDREKRIAERGRQVLSLPLEPRTALLGVAGREAGISTPEIVELCQAIESPPGGQESLSLEQWLSKRKKERLDNRPLGTHIGRRLERIEPVSSEDRERIILRAYADTVAQLSSDRAVPQSPRQPALLFKPTHPPGRQFGVLLSSRPQGGSSGPRSAVSLYLEISTETMWEELMEDFVESETLIYQPEQRQVRRRTVVQYGRLEIESSTHAPRPGPDTAALLAENIRAEELGEPFHELCRRLQLLLMHQPERVEELNALLGPELSPENLSQRILLNYLGTQLAWGRDSSRELEQHARGLLSYPLCRQLERELPTAVQLPGRRKPARISYPSEQAPYVESKLQDFFGWAQPRLLGGKVELVCHLLAPNGRACQITTDLETFWKGSYQQVRKDLRGRYPKHRWPENPSRESDAEPL